MWIAGEFDTEQIKCSIIAKKEVERLSVKAQEIREKLFFASDDYSYVTFLNARSLRKHQEDIVIDEDFMKSDIIGIAETHLNENETVELDGFDGNFVNDGKGKGIASFTKILPKSMVKIKKENFSSIFLIYENLRIAFLYVSKGFNIKDVNATLLPLLKDTAKPTILMGDMNYHHLEERHPLKSLFADIGYKQMVERQKAGAATTPLSRSRSARHISVCDSW